jgi:hypothetical protein
MKRYLIVITLFLSFQLLLQLSIHAKNLRVFYYREEELARTRILINEKDPRLMPSFVTLTRSANSLLTTAPYAVTMKTKVPPSGDKHDYFSLGPYYWPDTTRPNGLPYVSRDGIVNPESEAGYDSKPKSKMASDVESLSLMYYFSKDEKYAQKATQFIHTFFLDTVTRMNPNMKFSQARPGTMINNPIGVLESSSFIKVVDAVGLLEDSKSWTLKDQKELEKWFNEYLEWALTSPSGIKEGQMKNNHGTWYHAQIVSFALFTHQDEIARQWMEKSKKLIDSQIEPDGSQPLELKRTKPFSYSLYNLNAFLTLAELGQSMGIDLFHYQSADGRSIKKAIDYMALYVDPDKRFPLKDITPHGISRATVANYLVIASRNYNDPVHQKLLNQFGDKYLKSSRVLLTYPPVK